MSASPASWPLPWARQPVSVLRLGWLPSKSRLGSELLEISTEYAARKDASIATANSQCDNAAGDEHFCRHLGILMATYASIRSQMLAEGQVAITGGQI